VDAIIPASDIDKKGRLNLKIWAPEKLPEALIVDLHCSHNAIEPHVKP